MPLLMRNPMTANAVLTVHTQVWDGEEASQGLTIPGGSGGHDRDSVEAGPFKVWVDLYPVRAREDAKQSSRTGGDYRTFRAGVHGIKRWTTSSFGRTPPSDRILEIKESTVQSTIISTFDRVHSAHETVYHVWSVVFCYRKKHIARQIQLS